MEMGDKFLKLNIKGQPNSNLIFGRDDKYVKLKLFPCIELVESSDNQLRHIRPSAGCQVTQTDRFSSNFIF
jgi:hypothetical protein